MSRPVAPDPGHELGRYRLLSPSAGIRVSPICLGTMSLGHAWEQVMAGGTTQEEAFKFIDAYWEKGGNFIDIANSYQEGQSEKFVGAWMKERNNRDQIVLATKYTIGYRNNDPDVKVKVNYQGNHRKSLFLSVNDSLKKLQTDYIDLLYLHMWDYSTSVPEVMQALDALVKQNKVLYLGISDTPAWLVVKANEYARAHGLAQFVVYQGHWSLTARDFEREVLPMTRYEGMSVAPWGVLGQGKYKTEAEIKARTSFRYGTAQTEEEKTASAALQKVAAEIGGDVSLGAIAVAWALNKAPYVFPIIGGRSVDQLGEVLKALEIVLTPEQIKSLEESAPFVLGFPYNMFGSDPSFGDAQPSWFVASAATVKWVKSSAPIKPGPVQRL